LAATSAARGSALGAGIWLGAASAVNLGATTVAGLYLARLLPIAEFGRLAFVLNAYLLLVLVAGLGLTVGVSAEVASGRSRGAAEVWENVAALAMLRLLTAALAVACGALVAALSGDPLLLLGTVAAASYIVQDFVAGILQGLLRTRTVSLLLVTQPVSYLAVILWLQPSRAEQVMEALVATFLPSLALAAAVVAALRLPWRRPTWGTLARLGRAVALSGHSYLLSFLQMGFLSVAILVLGALGYYAEAAVLSIIFTLVRPMYGIWTAVLAAGYFPRLHALGSLADPEARSLFDGFARAAGALSIPVGLGLAVFAQPVLALLFGGRYDGFATYLAGASPLVVLLALEGLITWTLLAQRGAVWASVALLARFSVVAAACLVVAVVPGSAAWCLPFLVAGHVIAGAVGVLLALRRAPGRAWLRLPLRPLLLSIAITGAGFVGLRYVVPPPYTAAAQFAVLAVVGLGSWLIGLYPLLSGRVPLGLVPARSGATIVPRRGEPVR